MPSRYWLSLLFTMVLFLGAGLAVFLLNQWQPTHKPLILKPVAVNLALFQSQQPIVPVNTAKPTQPVQKPVKQVQVKPIIKKISPPKILHKRPKVTLTKRIAPVKLKRQATPASASASAKKIATPTISKVLSPSKPVQKAVLSNRPQYSKQTIATAEQTYLQALASVLAQGAKNSYPNRAKRRHWEGTVILEFTLLANGKIVSTQVKKVAQRKVFNEAALSIIHEAMQDNFKPFPKQIQRTQWTIQVPIEYQLKH